MRELLRNRILAAVIGLLFFLPGAAIFLLLLFGNEPPVGQFSLFGVTPPNGPLSGYLQPSGDGPHIVGSLIALGLMFVLPAIGVLINVAASEGNVLKNLARDLGIAAIVGAVLTLPLAVLELTLAKVSISNLPFPLFAILWLLPTTFLVVLAPIVRSVRLGKGLFANPIALAFRLGFLVLIALFWTGLMSDQLPCFLGVPNCD